MKTKQERIEEMVSIMAASNEPFVDVPIDVMPSAAEALYNARYRKEDEVRKETAEKFYDKVNENICVFQLENKNQEFTDGYAQAIADICGRLDQVAKQFGVEIEE